MRQRRLEHEQRHNQDNLDKPDWVITGISRMDGTRYEISRPMYKQEAEIRLAREIDNRRRQKYPAYTRLRIERRLPILLTLNF